MTSALENIKSIDLEEWLTLATAPAPTKLKQGQSPDMQNVWTDEKPGSVITAPGFIKVGTIPSGNPVTFCINYFNTSAGTQTFVVSDNSTVWTTIDFQNYTPIITGLSSSFQLRGAVIRDKLWLTNGSDAVRVFDGTNVAVLDGSILAQVVIQDMTYKAVANSGISPSQITIAYTTGGTAGSEVVTVNGSDISVQIQSGVSTNGQILSAINASPAALALVSAIASGSHAESAPVAPTALAGGVPSAPRGRYISYHDERVWLYHVSSNRSAVFFSSLTDSLANIIAPDDPSAWDTVDNFLQISEGDADFGTGMILYRGYLHFFKQYSIWRLVGYDEYTYSRVKTRASTGTRFQESLQELDSLVHLIGIDGIYVFDGEESVRISDIIDPATASQTAFGFNQLQQPNTNNQFWEVTATPDWNAGTVPTNVAIDEELDLIAADDSQADFQAGPVQTNIDTTSNPGFIQLDAQTNGAAGGNIASGKTGNLKISQGSELIIGQASYITDGDLTRSCGFKTVVTNDVVSWQVDLGTAYYIGSATLKSFTAIHNFAGAPAVSSLSVQYSDDGVSYTTIASFSVPAPVSNVIGPTDLSVNFTGAKHRYWQIVAISSFDTVTLVEVQIFLTGFVTSGSFTSKTLDLGITPASLGIFNATEILNGETTSYFTQSSADGSAWDSAVSCTNGGAIGSVPRRYLRWGVNLSSDAINTPQIDAVYLPTVYLSAIHNTGGNIFAWGPFESDRSLSGQTITYYYRTATTSAEITSATWNLIVPGGVISDPVTNQYVQFRFEISGGTASNLPTVDSVTINWVVGTAGQPQTLQNVASTYWRNRYWLSAAGPSATANNTILIRGKKTFQSPWMLKDWRILSFTRYFDSLYGGSSVDGSIYQLDTGYSEAGLAMDSYFETQDFTFGGFTCNLTELLVEAERTGPWNLIIGVSLDGGNTFDNYKMDLTPSTYDGEYIKRIQGFSYTTTRFRLRFSTNGVDTPFQVHRCLAFYTLSGVRGSIKGDYM